ncbi:PIG-L family deacetylase [Methylomonas sp. UP202]|uniref:PIG-L deacetylase family protein n=1 Tax=Methylomonas sp. UP202 TaxID=3040943 RepID=UPI00247A5D17|nr:PIG-L family deacetylase [Methylomonas sp. UP202]WGS84500.1 PIG-L family deacetylase [Methylomonas sp. UP202]
MRQSNRVWHLMFFWLSVAVALPAAAAPEQALDVGRGERLLILAPHPDDESLSAAGLAQRVFANGGSVRSVVVTSGDAYVDAVVQQTGKRKPSAADFLAFGERRLDESRRAAQVLGKGFLHLDLLGFSDGSIYSALVSHWRRNQPMRSDFTGFDHVPYSEAVDRGYAQDGQDLLSELVAILRETRPTMIAFPDVMENDSDHAGLGMFTLLAVRDWLAREPSQNIHPKMLAYLIHWRPGWPTGSNWGIAQDWSGQPMQLPDDLPLRGHHRVCLNLMPAEVATKRQAMAEYQTQQLIMGDFLASFVRSSECFTQLQTGDTQRIENVVEHWRHVRKAFDSHPLTRRKI